MTEELNENSQDDMPKWTKEEILELVKLYKSYPHLWNKNSDLYQNKHAREGAFLSILSKMGPNKFKSAEDVRIKLKSLRNTYREVLKKKARLPKYETKLIWFNEFREIMDADRLEPVKQEPDSDNNIGDENVVEYSEPTSTSSAITSEYIETMADEENTQNVVSELTPQATINVAPIPHKRINLEEHDKDSAGPSHDMRRQRKETVNDEFQMFADNIEEQLRKLEEPLEKDDMSTWTDEETLELVKLYKLYPELWNKTSELYRNKEAREGALLSIMSKTGTDKFKTAQDVKDKLNALRTKYHQAVRRKGRSEKKGSLYTPSFSWFNEFGEIVDGGRVELVKQGPVRNNLSDEINSEYSEPTSTSNDITSEYIETMADEENTQYVISELIPQATINVAPIPHKRIKLEEHDKDSAGPSHDMRRQGKETVNDEFQMFADNIAEQLRKLPLDRALKIQLAIQSILAEERTQLYRKSMRKAHE